jgi:Tol biopolymer transport system component
MDSDGTDVTQLTTQTAGYVVAPAISPDGTKIAFAADCNTITVSSSKASLTDCGHDFEIFTMTIDGDNNVTAVAKLTANTDNDGALGPNPFFAGFGISTPSWSPDGTQIAFTSDRDGGDLDIFIMDADGSGVIQLTSSSADDYDPFWLPGGEEIAFVSDRDGGVPQIFKINVTTKAVTQLTTSGGNVTPARE